MITNVNAMAGSIRVDLNLFRVFMAVYRAGSLTQAAAQLHLTQPAISNALTRLRQQIGDPLFIREGRRMVPSLRARQIAPQVEQALTALQTVTRTDSHFDAATAQRRYQIGMRDLLEFVLLPDLLNDLQQHAPHISLQSRPIERRRLERMLASGGLDLAVDVAIPTGEDIHRELLLRDSLCVVTRSGHRLAHQRLTLQRWLSQPHVVVSARTSGPVLEDLLLNEHDLKRNIVLRCQHYSAACHVVARTDCMLMLPRRYAAQFSRAFGLIIKPPPVPLAPLELMMYWHRNADGDSGLKWLRNRIASLSADNT